MIFAVTLPPIQLIGSFGNGNFSIDFHFFETYYSIECVSSVNAADANLGIVKY